MAFELTQRIECSQASQAFPEPDKNVQIGILKIGNEEHKIFQGITRIGRLASCEIRLQDITVSKIHSEIDATKDDVFISDLKSSNRTRLNNRILRPNHFFEVKDGAALKFGNIEGKFFLLNCDNRQALGVPETPLNLRNQSASDDLLIQATPAVDGRFRRPQLLIHKKAFKQPVINDISLAETQVQSRNNVQDLETQCSSAAPEEPHHESKTHIQELETQVGEVNDIENMETQFSVDEEETQGFSQRPISSEPDIQSGGNIQESTGKSRIEDLETQFDGIEDIQDVQTQFSGIESNGECSKSKEDTSRGKINGKGQLERQEPIQELDEEEIYDLPTQPNCAYLENLKKQELLKDSQSRGSSPDLLHGYTHVIIAESDEEGEEGKTKGVDVDEDKYRDVEAIVNQNVFPDVINTENNPNESKNLDDPERTESLKKKAEKKDKFKRNGVISESDSDDDNNVKNKEKVVCDKSKEKNVIEEAANDEEKENHPTDTSVILQNNSDSETDFEDNNQEESKSTVNNEKKKNNIPQEILELLNASKKTSAEDYDTDDSCSAPTQLIPPRPREIPEVNSSLQEEVLPTQIIPVSPADVSLVDNNRPGLNDMSSEDLEPTQRIDLGNRKSVDKEITVFRGFESSVVPQYLLNDEDSDGDMGPTQKIELPKRFQSQKLSLKSPPVSERSRREVIDELPPTQVLEDNEPQTQLINNDKPSEFRGVEVLDDDEPQTQLIKQLENAAEVSIESPTTRSRTRTKTSLDSSVRRSDIGDNLGRMVTSTPVLSSSPDKRRKFSLSLKQIKREPETSEEKKPISSDINSKGSSTINETPGPSASASSSIAQKITKRKINSKSKGLKKRIKEDKSSILISDSSDDEDMDYEKVNAMADRFIASSEMRGDQSRTTKQSTEAPSTSLSNTDKRVENNTSEKEALIKPRRGRPRKLQKKETPPAESKKETKTVITKKRKFQSNESSNLSSEFAKRRRKMQSPSDESSGAASQEVQRILEGTESLREPSSRSLRSKDSFSESKKMKYCVLFTGIEDEDGSKANAVSALGGTITRDPHEATILVTDKVRRTVKFFCAVSRSILIASLAWLEASVKAKRFLDPREYQLHDSVAEAQFHFSLNRSLMRSKAKKLLEGQTVLITPKISGPSIPDLKTMVQVSGGKALVRAPRTWTENTTIISCAEDLPYVRRILEKAPCKVHVVTLEFLLSGILQQQLQYEEFSLSF